MRVRAHDPDGNMGNPQSDGSIEYGNGSKVTHDQESGSITLHRGSGGTTTQFGRNDKHPDRPVYNSDNDSYSYADGTEVRAHDPEGHLGTPQADGSIEYSDGTRVTHDNRSGDTKFVMGDGSVSVHPGNSGGASAPEYNSENDSFVYSDGTQVKAHDRSGNMGTPQADGSVEYSDGTRVTHDNASGDTKFVMGDGSVQVHHRSGAGDTAPSYDGGRDTFVFGDGYSVRATDPSGQRGQVEADGSIRYSDGTRVSHDAESGDTKVEHADGHVTVRPGHASDDDSSSDSDSSADSSDSGDSSDSSDDSGSSDDSSDSSADDSSDTKSDTDSGSDDSGDSDSGDDDSSSDEARSGFEDGRGSDGGPRPSAASIVDDRVARMKGEKRDPESPEDGEPGNGGSAPDSVSQPGPDSGHGGSPLARPSAEGDQSPIGSVVVPTVKPRSSVGGGDCFKSSGCDDTPTGGFQLDPFDRDPVTNPGGN
jgi:clumping factor A